MGKKYILTREILEEAKSLVHQGVFNPSLLGKAITYLESTREADQKIVLDFIEAHYSSLGQAWTFGLSGTPGVGKSSFLDAWVSSSSTSLPFPLVILSIDPSGPLSGTFSTGAVLGDKTRMSRISLREDIFIRPSSSKDIGGRGRQAVGHRTFETMLLAELLGAKTIIVESVGVGQVEDDLARLVEFFCLMIAPGEGDSLQGIKQGIIALADLVLVNKADGDLLSMAKSTAQDYEQGGSRKVLLVSAKEEKGLEKVTDVIRQHFHQHNQSSIRNRQRGIRQHVFEKRCLEEWEYKIFPLLLEKEKTLLSSLVHQQSSPIQMAKRVMGALQKQLLPVLILGLFLLSCMGGVRGGILQKPIAGYFTGAKLTQPIPFRLVTDVLEQERGLSDLATASYPHHEGLLFSFEDGQGKSFWMKDTYFDLAIIFLDEHFKVVKIYPRAKACAPPQCTKPFATDSILAKHVLELSADFFERISLQEGDRLVKQQP